MWLVVIGEVLLCKCFRNCRSSICLQQGASQICWSDGGTTMPLNEEVGPTTVFGPTLTANNGLVHDFHQLHLALLNPNKMGCTFCNKLRRVLLMILVSRYCNPRNQLGGATRESVEPTQSNKHETHMLRLFGWICSFRAVRAWMIGSAQHELRGASYDS